MIRGILISEVIFEFLRIYIYTYKIFIQSRQSIRIFGSIDTCERPNDIENDVRGEFLDHS